MKYERITNDYYGNPRYLVHYTDLGLSDYVSLPNTGLKKYRGKAYGGMYVFTSYEPKKFLESVVI